MTKKSDAWDREEKEEDDQQGISEELREEVKAYRKAEDERDISPKEIHKCPVFGIKFQYSLWRDFKCPAVNGCGFEYKVKVEDNDGKEITDEEERRSYKANKLNFSEDEKKKFK